MEGINLIHGDSLQALKGYADNHFDVAIVDPPYGIGKKLAHAGEGKIRFGDVKAIAEMFDNYKKEEMGFVGVPSIKGFDLFKHPAHKIKEWMLAGKMTLPNQEEVILPPVKDGYLDYKK